MSLHVLTGGPSGGKTSVLRRLSARGHHTRPEAARMVFDQLASEGKNKAEVDLGIIQDKIEDMNRLVERNLPARPTFIDRSYADNYAYRRHFGLPSIRDETMQMWTETAYDNVFLFKPLEEIADGRREDYDEAWEIHDRLCEVYMELGYDPIVVPDLPVDQRVNFIEQNV